MLLFFFSPVVVSLRGLQEVDDIFDGWMKSPGHRANILKPEFTEIGIGAVRSETGKQYCTQNFGRPR
ncbi:MAG TPA: CAP domain-containing protein [Gemmataceae bacterium]|nr:CAP domain-containing protein [Gemmataceae bacterium]